MFDRNRALESSVASPWADQVDADIEWRDDDEVTFISLFLSLSLAIELPLSSSLSLPVTHTCSLLGAAWADEEVAEASHHSRVVPS